MGRPVLGGATHPGFDTMQARRLGVWDGCGHACGGGPRAGVLQGQLAAGGAPQVVQEHDVVIPLQQPVAAPLQGRG